MTDLELRYRRLLACFPPAHRAEYGTEMLGVLMAGTRPGQRFPSPGDAVDLMLTGVAARLGHARQATRRPAWRDAAAVVGLLATAVLAAVAGSRLLGGLEVMRQGQAMRAYGVDGLLLLDVAARTVAWFAVLVAALTGLRRTAFGLAVAAAAVEVAALAMWLPGQEFRVVRMSWVLIAAALAVAALGLARRGRSALRVLGPRGAALTGVAVLVAAGLVPGLARVSMLSSEDGFAVGDLTLPLAGALVLAGVWQSGRRVRRRVLVLLSPLPALVAAQQLAWSAFDMVAAPTLTAPMVATQVVVMTVVPAVTVGLGVQWLRARERRAVVDS